MKQVYLLLLFSLIGNTILAQAKYRELLVKHRILKTRAIDVGSRSKAGKPLLPADVYYNIFGYDSVVKTQGSIDMEYEFDDKGRPVKQINYWWKGGVYDSSEYTYNNDGSYVKVKRYRLPEYDLEIGYYNSNGNPTMYWRDSNRSKTQYFYDSLGYPIKHLRDDDEAYSTTFVNTYNDKGQLIKRRQYNNGEFWSEWLYEYDQRGLIIRLQILYADKKIPNSDYRTTYFPRK